MRKCLPFTSIIEAAVTLSGHLVGRIQREIERLPVCIETGNCNRNTGRNQNIRPKARSRMFRAYAINFFMRCSYTYIVRLKISINVTCIFHILFSVCDGLSIFVIPCGTNIRVAGTQANLAPLPIRPDRTHRATLECIPGSSL